jgi:hypothetical protein
MIIESLLTSLDPAGALNCAPMGVEWGEEAIVIKPFLETVTFQNLRATGAAVINLTHDVLLFAQAVTHHPAAASPATFSATRIRGAVLDVACSWREVEVVSIDDTPPRSRIVTRVVHHGTRREFLGFNRARHAVLEAAILATRTHLIGADEIRREYERLRVIVDKTAGPREQDAMQLLEDYVRVQVGTPAA